MDVPHDEHGLGGEEQDGQTVYLSATQRQVQKVVGQVDGDDLDARPDKTAAASAAAAAAAAAAAGCVCGCGCVEEATEVELGAGKHPENGSGGWGVSGREWVGLGDPREGSSCREAGRCKEARAPAVGTVCRLAGAAGSCRGAGSMAPGGVNSGHTHLGRRGKKGHADYRAGHSRAGTVGSGRNRHVRGPWVRSVQAVHKGSEASAGHWLHLLDLVWRRLGPDYAA